MSAIVVAGAAHLEILARASGSRTDADGSVSIDVGGAACQCVLALIRLGTPARFLATLSASPYSQLVANHLAGYGVENFIQYREDIPSAIHSVHLNARGRIVSSVRSVPLGTEDLDEELASTAMTGARALLIDCNLAPSAMTRLITLATSLGLAVYAVASPPAAASRLAQVAARFRRFTGGRGAAPGGFVQTTLFQPGLTGIVLAQRTLPSLRSRATLSVERLGEAAAKLGASLFLLDPGGGCSVGLLNGEQASFDARRGSDSQAIVPTLEAFAAGLVTMIEVHGKPAAPAALAALQLASGESSTDTAYGGLGASLAQFMHHASHDAMTGALNRASVEWELNRLIERRQPKGRGVAVLMLDIDNFKRINDTFGHPVGDQVIQRVCEIARDCLRGSDLLARWGGEEFLCVLPGAQSRDAVAVAERIRKRVEAQLLEPQPITVSIGCSDTSEDSRDMRELIKRADEALYTAKRCGRNLVRYWQMTSEATPDASQVAAH